MAKHAFWSKAKTVLSALVVFVFCPKFLLAEELSYSKYNEVKQSAEKLGRYIGIVSGCEYSGLFDSIRESKSEYNLKSFEESYIENKGIKIEPYSSAELQKFILSTLDEVSESLDDFGIDFKLIIEVNEALKFENERYSRMILSVPKSEWINFDNNVFNVCLAVERSLFSMRLVDLDSSPIENFISLSEASPIN